jgi:predicted transcriptional regulator
MTTDVAVVAPDTSLREAARQMDNLNVGSLPVADKGKLVGIITDRDITVRATAVGESADTTRVDEIMTTDVQAVRVDDGLDDVASRMADIQVRRMPVLDETGAIVGIVSLGDLAVDAGDVGGDVLRQVSEPAEPDRSGTLTTRRADQTRGNVERSDDLISEDVAAALLKMDDVEASEIDIEVDAGALTLSGTVDSYANKQDVESALRDVNGVRSIDNNLRIRKGTTSD